MDLGVVTRLLSDNSTLLFYLSIIVLLYLNRKRFDIQGKIVAIYRTTIGLKIINRIGTRHRELVRLLGYIGIGIGFIGMVLMAFVLCRNLYNIVFIPGAQSEIAPAIPGVSIPGSPIFVPLISGWIALFIIILVHEFSHGIVATAHKIRVKASGIVFFGPLMGAFVEPDEKKLQAAPDVTQYAIYAAGPFSNVLLAIVAMLIAVFLIAPIYDRIAEPVGFSVGLVEKYTPAYNAGLREGMVFTGFNDNTTATSSAFFALMNDTVPGESLTIHTTKGDYTATLAHIPVKGIGTKGVVNLIIQLIKQRPLQTVSVETAKGNFTITALANPAGSANGPIGIRDFINITAELNTRRPGESFTMETAQGNYLITSVAAQTEPPQGYLGVRSFEDKFVLKQDLAYLGFLFPVQILGFAFELFEMLFMLSLGIGLANLLPLGPVDGGRMLQVALQKTNGKPKGQTLWKYISLGCFIILMLNIIPPIIKAILGV